MQGLQALATSVDGRSWSCIDFVSDLHLQADDPATWRCFEDYLRQTPAQALFILGDLFEVWVGDDLLQDPSGGFEQACAQALAQASQRITLHWMPGNRDFLTGLDFLRATGMVGLADPCQLILPDEMCVLSHGDAMCTSDQAYQTFREQVRSPAWQKAFLAKPLAERQALARAMRAQSQAHQQAQTIWADVDANAARVALGAARATHLIHGHTHQPADHDLGSGRSRSVLSDWCAQAQPARAQVLRWQGSWDRISAKTP